MGGINGQRYKALFDTRILFVTAVYVDVAIKSMYMRNFESTLGYLVCTSTVRLKMVGCHPVVNVAGTMVAVHALSGT